MFLFFYLKIKIKINKMYKEKFILTELRFSTEKFDEESSKKWCE